MAKKPKRVYRLPVDPDEDWNEPDLNWRDASRQCKRMLAKIEDSPASVHRRAFTFFEDISEKVASMRSSIRESQSVTRGQQNALNAWEKGIDKCLKRD